jgi:hypothetical protein
MNIANMKLHYGPLKEWASVDGKARLVDGLGFFVGHTTGLDVASVSCTASQDPVEQEAIARLFAAAPDLLAACEYAIQWIDNIAKADPDAFLDAMPNDTVGRPFIRNAIKKAKGL